jgi:hypothetical protein
VAVTLTNLRREVGQEMKECVVGEVDDSLSTAIYDGDLMDAGEEETRYDGAWLRVYWIDGTGVLVDETRRIRQTGEGVTAYNPATGWLHVSRPWSHNPPAGSQYEIHTLIDPVQLDRCIENGVARCTYLTAIAITPVSNQRRYSLSAYTTLTKPAQVVGVYLQSDPTDLDETTRRPLRWWQMAPSTTAGLDLYVRPQSFATGDVLVVEYQKPCGELIDTDAGEEISERWAKTAALVEVWNYLANSGPAQDVGVFEKRAVRAAAKFTEESRNNVSRKRALPRHDETPVDY